MIWIPIPNYEDLYHVNEYGEVKSLERIIYHVKENKTVKIVRTEKIIGGFIDVNGLSGVILVRDNKRKRVYRHRLVANLFLEGPQNECVVHLDGNKLNNHFSNLKWDTRAENRKVLNRLWVSNWHLHVLSLKTGVYYDSLMDACTHENIHYGGASYGLKLSKSKYKKVLMLV
jgi:hypothetical protein